MPAKQSWQKTCFQVICCIITAFFLTICVWLIITAYTKAAEYKPLPKPTTPSTTALPPFQCQNNGTFRDGICICHEEWKGTYCEIANFCEASVLCGPTGCEQNATFSRTIIGRYGYSNELCQDPATKVTRPKATCLCSEINGMPSFGDLIFVDCNENLDTLSDEVENATSDSELRSIAEKMQVLTSQPEQLRDDSIVSAFTITEQIFLKTEQFNATETSEAAAVAVTTVSQLLEAKEDIYKEPEPYAAAQTLTQSLEVFSLHNSTNDTQVVQPNLAVQSLSINEGRNQGILFTALRGLNANESLVPSRIMVNNNASDLKVNSNADIQIFLDVTTEEGVPGRIGFVLYQNAKFFRSNIYKQNNPNSSSRRIVSGSIANGTLNKVELLFRTESFSENIYLHDYSCVSWNYSEKEWSTLGCIKDGNVSHFLLCSCNHTTHFAMLLNFSNKYKYAEPLEIISKVGCGLSIAGLLFTILFHVITRKTRRTSITLIWVNLCVSMLIANIIFISGITNENQQETNRINTTENKVLESDMTYPTGGPRCTAVAALLHYFLLATFIWTAVFAVQMYLRLSATLGQLPKHFMWIAYASGWGLPAVVMLLTFVATYDESNITKYRQEEFCWLASFEQEKFQFSKPLFAAFLLPVGIILVVNIVIFLFLTFQIFWKNNEHLQSTRKKSNMKKFMSTLSVAVLFGITWSLGYLTLIENELTRTIFSFVFCIINTTQGFQIFLLFVVRTSSFKEKMAPVMDYLSSLRMYLHSKKVFFDRATKPPNIQESYRQLESVSSSSWMSVSETD